MTSDLSEIARASSAKAQPAREVPGVPLTTICGLGEPPPV
jgi:hypothetical protein